MYVCILKKVKNHDMHILIYYWINVTGKHYKMEIDLIFIFI